jgi:hypothetical protein
LHGSVDTAEVPDHILKESPLTRVPERREGADRRDGWRGGRRDTDWTGRPIGPEPVPRIEGWWQRLLHQNPDRRELRELGGTSCD